MILQMLAECASDIFVHSWCRPCKMLSPILEKLTDNPDVKSGSGFPLDLVTIDTDTEVELAQEYNVRNTLTFRSPYSKLSVCAWRTGELPANCDGV